jgi:hypothetical protein
MKNPFGKTVDRSKPYAIYVNKMAGFEFRVLKTYQRPDKERTNGYARWFLATKSPFTYGSYELGDGYVNDILSDPQIELISATKEWEQNYENTLRI